MAEVQFSVSWDAYQKSICNGLSSLQQRGEFVDMTIAADGHHVKVHQMILSLVSPFIKELISSARCPHPVIFLNLQHTLEIFFATACIAIMTFESTSACPALLLLIYQVSYQTLQSILEYAYTGEVLVTRDRLGDFLEACKALHIKGLEKANNYAETSGSEIHTQFDGKTNKTLSIDGRGNNSFIQTKDNDNTTMDDDYMDSCHLDDDDDDKDHQKEVNSTPLHMLIKENDPPPPTMLQYTVSCQGSLQMVLNRYMYGLNYTRKNSERLWRCTFQRNKCPAFVTTKGDRVLERSGAHNHAFHDKQILKRIRTGNMFTVLSEAESSASVVKKRKKDEED